MTSLGRGSGTDLRCFTVSQENSDLFALLYKIHCGFPWQAHLQNLTSGIRASIYPLLRNDNPGGLNVNAEQTATVTCFATVATRQT